MLKHVDKFTILHIIQFQILFNSFSVELIPQSIFIVYLTEIFFFFFLKVMTFVLIFSMNQCIHNTSHHMYLRQHLHSLYILLYSPQKCDFLQVLHI